LPDGGASHEPHGCDDECPARGKVYRTSFYRPVAEPLPARLDWLEVTARRGS